MKEHEVVRKVVDELRAILRKMENAKGFDSVSDEMEHLKQIVHHLIELRNHELREEMALFPYLERYGIVGPPQVMRMEHEQMGWMKEKLQQLINNYENMSFQEFFEELDDTAMSLINTLWNHAMKEDNVLLPMSLQVIQENEWKDIRKKFDELGYCCYYPEETPVELER